MWSWWVEDWPQTSQIKADSDFGFAGSKEKVFNRKGHKAESQKTRLQVDYEVQGVDAIFVSFANRASVFRSGNLCCDVREIVPRIGMADFPLTILASPILMNREVGIVWVVLYYGLFGGLLWYFIGRVFDRLVIG
jgi:hypothetical protein